MDTNLENDLVEQIQSEAETQANNMVQMANTASEALADPAVTAFNALKTTSEEDVVRALQNKATIEVATTNEDVRNKMEDNAKAIIDNHLTVTKNEAEAKNEQSFWNRNKSAVKMYGYSENDPRPNWQTALMKVGSNIWFVIYWIIATVTVCPLSVFFDVFRAIFKKGWLAMVVAVVVYLAIVIGVPWIGTIIAKFNK